MYFVRCCKVKYIKWFKGFVFNNTFLFPVFNKLVLSGKLSPACTAWVRPSPPTSIGNLSFLSILIICLSLFKLPAHN